MKEIFFNEDGSLKIDESVMEQPSYIKIMEDGIVTADELEEQTRLVVSLFRKIEDTFSEEQKLLVQKLLVETNVLSAVFKHRGTQVAIE